MKKLALIFFALSVSWVASAQKIPSWKINDVADFYNQKNDFVYVVNFWSTACGSCVSEIGYLQNMIRKYEKLKVKLLLVSLDQPSLYPHQVKKFVKKNNFPGEVVWLNEPDDGRFCPVIDKNWTGAAPATLLVNGTTGYKKFIETAISEPQFEKELRLAIGKD